MLQVLLDKHEKTHMKYEMMRRSYHTQGEIISSLSSLWTYVYTDLRVIIMITVPMKRVGSLIRHSVSAFII